MYLMLTVLAIGGQGGELVCVDGTSFGPKREVEDKKTRHSMPVIIFGYLPERIVQPDRNNTNVMGFSKFLNINPGQLQVW